MPLSSAKTHVDLPDDVDHSELANRLEQWLGQNDSIEKIERHEGADGPIIEAESTSTLLTWGQKITIMFKEDKVQIRVVSPDQWIDWGKSNETAKKISAEINNNISSPNPISA